MTGTWAPYCLWILCGEIRGEGNRVSLPPQPLLCCFWWLLLNLVWEVAGVREKIKLTQKDKRSQHNNSHGHLLPCFLSPSPLPSNSCFCVSFWSIFDVLLQWSPWYWGSQKPNSWLEVLVILLVSKNDAWVVIWNRWLYLESSAILMFLFIIV